MKHAPLFITITGTESTGKSTLAEALAAHYNTTFIADVSRIYLEQLNGNYTQKDVLQIARQIIEQEDKQKAETSTILFSDNDLLNIKIWLQYYNWTIPHWLETEITKRKSDLYLLCNIDLPWVPDTQRKNAADRPELLNLFKVELTTYNCHYKIINGQVKERTQNAITQIDNFINSVIR